MFRDGVDRPVAPGLAPDKADRVLPSFRLAPALWLRCRLPAWLARPGGGARPVPVDRTGRRRGGRRGRRLGWRSAAGAVGLPAAAPGAGSSSIGRWSWPPSCGRWPHQVGLWCLYLQLRLLDLPATVVGATIPA